jgi:RHS repeat-associated protein
MEYRYSPTQNNGQITQQKDWNTGEEVTYTYDSLQRLIGAVTTDSPTVTQWGQAFTYDGFGNRTSASVTKGSAPYGSWSYDPATNRMAGFYDANGNMTMTGTPAYNGYTYDVENRLVSVPAPFNYNQNVYDTELYAYAPDNKRIWKRKPDGTEELYFYGISGQKLVTYAPLVAANGDFFMTTLDTSLYFGSRTIISRGVTVALDRTGSNQAGGSRYFPYGEEQQVTAQDRDKFATYYRDSTTGLDYAQNRYYASTLARFISPDPYRASSQISEPLSWNRYAYGGNDPLNNNDPSGLCMIKGEEYPDGKPPCPDKTSTTVNGDQDPIDIDISREVSTPTNVTALALSMANARSVAIAIGLQKLVMATNISDCQALAAFADSVAAGRMTTVNFVSAFQVLTPGAAASALINAFGSASGVQGVNGAINLQPTYVDPSGNVQYYQASGFSSSYKDSIAPNSDQAHHFAAFFQLGFNLGSTVGNISAYFVELENGLTNQGDINLGMAAAALGAQVGSGKLSASQVGNAIRNQLCNK